MDVELVEENGLCDFLLDSAPALAGNLSDSCTCRRRKGYAQKEPSASVPHVDILWSCCGIIRPVALEGLPEDDDQCHSEVLQAADCLVDAFPRQLRRKLGAAPRLPDNYGGPSLFSLWAQPKSKAAMRRPVALRQWKVCRLFY